MREACSPTSQEARCTTVSSAQLVTSFVVIDRCADDAVRRRGANETLRAAQRRSEARSSGAYALQGTLLDVCSPSVRPAAALRDAAVRRRDARRDACETRSRTRRRRKNVPAVNFLLTPFFHSSYPAKLTGSVALVLTLSVLHRLLLRGGAMRAVSTARGGNRIETRTRGATILV